MDVPYRMRHSGLRFRLAVSGLVLLPAQPIAASIVVAGAALAQLSRGIHPVVARRSIEVFLTVLAFLALTRPSLGGALGLSILSGAFALVALSPAERSSGDSVRRLCEVRLLATSELFVYPSAVALAFGISASNENRFFLRSTLGNERASFFFSSSPNQAAAIAGISIVVAWGATSVRPSRGRRLALILTASYLLVAANYRLVLFWTVCMVGLLRYLSHRRVSSRSESTVVAPWVGRVAVVVLMVPLWWSTVAPLITDSVVPVISRVPGVGIRRATAAAEEVQTINSRTIIWDETTRLLLSADSSQLLIGYGSSGGDAEFQATVVRVLGTSFGDLTYISAHNLPLELVRRSGLVGALIAVTGVVVYLRSRRLVSVPTFLATSLLVLTSATDITVSAYPSLTFAVLLVGALLPLTQSAIAGPTGAEVDSPGPADPNLPLSRRR